MVSTVKSPGSHAGISSQSSGVDTRRDPKVSQLAGILRWGDDGEKLLRAEGVPWPMQADSGGFATAAGCKALQGSEGSQLKCIQLVC